MTNRFKQACRCTALLVLCVFASAVHAEITGKEMFDKKCIGCHTIGGGDKGGPDLQGVTFKRTEQWIEHIIYDPGRLTSMKDPVHLELVKKYGHAMPNLGISHDDAWKIIAYLKETDLAGAAAKPVGEPKEEKIVFTEELLQQGKALFTGEKHLSKRGAPCVACHALRYSGVRGGNWGIDLTEMYTNMGEEGLSGILKNPPFPGMKKMYEEKPLTDDEIKALVAFAKDAAVRKEAAPPHFFPWAGIAFFGVILGIFGIYKRRVR
jgi:mono/diheme cytochrome c family protein